MKRLLIIALAIIYVFGVGCASQQSVEDEEFSVSDSSSGSDASLDDFENDSSSSSSSSDSSGSDSSESSKSSDQASDSSSSEKDEFSELENDASPKSEETSQASNDSANQQQAQQQQQDQAKDLDEAALEDELNKIGQEEQQQQQAQQQPQDQQQQQAQNDELSLDDPQQQPPQDQQQQQQQAQQQPEQMPEQVIADQQQQQQPPPEQQQTPPPVVEAPPAEAPVEITGLKYKANDNGGTIVIEASGPIKYTSRKNEQLNQVIIEVDNVILPPKFMRTLNTKDMVGTIGAIDAYQNKDSKIARFVVQMRGTGKDLAIQQEGNSLLVVGEGPMAQNVADTGGTPAPEAGAIPAPDGSMSAPEVAAHGGSTATDSGGGEEVPMSSDEPLQAKTLEEFLTTQNNFTGKKISIEMQAPVLEVIKLIMDESGANIIIDESVGKVGGDKISFKLREIPWDQALVTVLKMKGLAYSRVGNVLRITRQEDLENEQKKLDDLQQNRSVASFKVKMFPLSYSKPADMKTSIAEFITKDKGKTLVDTNTNSLIVTDSEEALAKIEKVIKVLDVAPAQVLIEAKIVEADEGFTRNLGVRWGFGGNPTEVSTNKDGQIVNLTPTARFNPNLGNSAVGNLGFTVGTLDLFGSLDASLSLGEQEDMAKVVSSPRIVTVNNKPATISQNSVVNFVTTSATTGAAGATPSQTVQQITAPLNLDVTPIVSNDGFVTMDISFKRNTLGAAGTAAGSLPPVQERNLKSSVIVKDGQTTVIGGIFNSQQTDSVDGVPGLKDVPFLGALFRGKNTINKKNELLIFVTPKILSKFNLKGTSEPFVN